MAFPSIHSHKEPLLAPVTPRGHWNGSRSKEKDEGKGRKKLVEVMEFQLSYFKP